MPDRTDIASLIRLGRDREAAELGASTIQGDDMDALAQLDQLRPALSGVMDALTPAELDKKTPCAKFTVRGVLEHMTAGAGMFTQAFGGQSPVAAAGTDVLDQIGPSLEALFGAMNEPGALDRTVAAPFGEVPGETFARFVVLDGLVHGWDISVATGLPYNPPATLVAEVDSFARGALDALRDGETFAAATTPPADATPIERLAAYTGRQVQGERA